MSEIAKNHVYVQLAFLYVSTCIPIYIFRGTLLFIENVDFSIINDNLSKILIALNPGRH